jgi:PAS domain S-box-containing protein
MSAGQAARQASRTGLRGRSPLARQALVLGGVALGAMILAWAALAIRGPGRVAPIWPANGLLLALLLRSPPRQWPSLLAAGYGGIVVGSVANGGKPALTAVLAVWNLAEVSLSAAAILTFGGRPLDLSRLRFIAVAGVAALGSAAVSACGAALVFHWLRRDLVQSVGVWTLANALGQMTAAPIVLAAPSILAQRPFPTRVMLTTLAAVAMFALAGGLLAAGARLDLAYLALAPLMVIVFQLETAGAALAILLTAMLTLALGARAAPGPLVGASLGLGDPMISLQVFLLSSVLLMMPTGAVLADRRAARDEARRSQARLQYFSDHSRDVVMRLAGNRRILDVSASVRALGYEPEDLIGEPVGRRAHPRDRARMFALFDRLTAGEPAPPGPQEWRQRTGAGDWIWMEGDVTVLRDGSGAVVEYVLVMRDITERKLAAEAVAESEARYRLLAENSRDIVFEFDVKANILYASAAVRSLGYAPEEVIGRNCFEFVHPDDVATARHGMAVEVDPSLRRGEVSHEWRVRTASGDYLWVEGNPAVVRDEDGRPVSFTDSVRDISHRKALEADLAAKQQEAEAAERARREAEARARANLNELARVSRALTIGEFATSIAHELNQPLAAIVANGAAALRWLAADPPETEEARLAVGRSIRDADRAAAVIARTRAMLAKTPPVFAEIDIADCINEALMFAEPELRRRGVELVAHIQRPLPPVEGDRVQLQQVLINLISNGADAMTASSERPRTLTVSAQASGPGEVTVSVEDAGCGLEGEAAARLFDGFFTTKAGGVGLGLAISRSIVEAHGGKLAASPGRPSGTVFRFTLRTAAERAA